MSLVEMVAVEMIPDLDGLIEVWIALFGRSEIDAVAPLCSQYWAGDWRVGIARRAIFDVARSRFPVQVRSMVRLLRAMTGSGFLDTDPLSTSSEPFQPLTEHRDTAQRHVFFYLHTLSTYSQVISASACAGPYALYERQAERYGSSSSALGLTYINTRPIKLPARSDLRFKSFP